MGSQKRPHRSRPKEDASRISNDVDLEQDLEDLDARLRAFDLGLSNSAQDRLLAFSRELIRYNDKHNLLSRPDVHNVIKKHVSSSLGVFLLVRPRVGQSWLDVGTGAGFPGMVLKLAKPEMNITLLDSAQKRIRFLEVVADRCGLPGTQIVRTRAETFLAEEGRAEGFDVVTSRAVSSLDEGLRAFGPFVRPGGRMVTFKGPSWKEEVLAAQSTGAFQDAGFSLEAVTRIPWVQSHIICLTKGLRH